MWCDRRGMAVPVNAGNIKTCILVQSTLYDTVRRPLLERSGGIVVAGLGATGTRCVGLVLKAIVRSPGY